MNGPNAKSVQELLKIISKAEDGDRIIIRKDVAGVTICENMKQKKKVAFVGLEEEGE